MGSCRGDSSQKIDSEFLLADTVTPVFVGDIQPFVIADKLTGRAVNGVM